MYMYMYMYIIHENTSDTVDREIFVVKKLSSTTFPDEN